MYYTNCFFIYSLLGFIFENIVYFILNNSGDSGILYGPITPIYGIGSIIIILISNYMFKELKLKKWVETIIVFLFVFVIITGLEYIGGFLIEKIFNDSLWDYSNLKYSLGKYIALEVSIAWGVLSLVLIYFIKPVIDKIITKIPKVITYIMIFILAIDIVITFINKMNYNKDTILFVLDYMF